MISVAIIMIWLGAGPDCIPASEVTLVLFEPDRPVCLEVLKGN